MARTTSGIIVACMLSVIGWAQPPQTLSRGGSDQTLPPPLTTYMGRTIADYMTFHGASWLLREERELEESPSITLKQLALKPGMIVCDLGCGNGFYSGLMAKQVAPGGKVYAVDIQPEMLTLLKARMQEARVDNVEPILGSPINPYLPEGKIDLVLMVDVYHEFSYPEHMLAAIRKSLAPNGKIALVEFRGEDPRVAIKPLHKMTKKQILTEYQANGFKLLSEFDELPIQHLMFFGRDDQWQKPQIQTNKLQNEIRPSDAGQTNGQPARSNQPTSDGARR